MNPKKMLGPRSSSTAARPHGHRVDARTKTKRTDAATGHKRGPAEGLPLILYFHDIVSDSESHYTEITIERLGRLLEIVGERFEWTDTTDLFYRPGAGPRAALTFDDGYATAADYLCTELKTRGIRAELFVVSSWVGTTRHVRPGSVRSFASWHDLADVVASGHRVGAHSVTHRPLDQLGTAEAIEEIEVSISTLQEKLQLPVRHFSYPFGRLPNPTVLEWMETSGIAGFATVRVPSASATTSPVLIRRDYVSTTEEEKWNEIVTEWSQHARGSAS